MFSALRHTLHLVYVGFVLMREGVFALIPKKEVPAPLRPLLWLLAAFGRRDAGNRGARIVAALTRLGPSYVKLGQFLATRPDLVGMHLGGALLRIGVGNGLVCLVLVPLVLAFAERFLLLPA